MASAALVTERVRLLIDQAHAGNVHEASKVSGVPSATLRALYSGKNVNPELKTLEALARPYEVSAGWFSEPSTLAFVPPTGISVVERVKMENGAYHNKRWLFIPWASWPLPGVYNQLLSYVVRAARHGKAPIIGHLKLDPDNPTDIYEVRAEVAKFLLAPLLSVESFAPQELPDQRSPADPKLIRRMRMLGMLWQDALRGAIADENSAR